MAIFVLTTGEYSGYHRRTRSSYQIPHRSAHSLAIANRTQLALLLRRPGHLRSQIRNSTYACDRQGHQQFRHGETQGIPEETGHQADRVERLLCCCRPANVSQRNRYPAPAIQVTDNSFLIAVIVGRSIAWLRCTRTTCGFRVRTRRSRPDACLERSWRSGFRGNVP